MFYNDKESWVLSELHYYEGTSVQGIDIAIAYQRIAHIFQREAKEVHAHYEFGNELDATPVAWYEPLPLTEIDRIASDVESLFECLPPNLHLGKVRKVRDYVILVSHCRKSGGKRFNTLISYWWADQCAQYATPVGRLLHKWFGILPKRFVHKCNQMDRVPTNDKKRNNDM